MNEDRIKRLRLIVEQQLKAVNAINAIENKIEKLGDDIMSLNNTDQIKISIERDDSPEQLLLRLRWNDHTAGEADKVRQVLRDILLARKEEYESRLERAIEQEEKRLAGIL